MSKERCHNFVTRKHLAFTENEINEIIENLKNQFADNKYGIKYDSHKADKDGLFTLVVWFKMPHYVGRDSENARFDIESVGFTIWKASGELEIDFKENKYEPFDGVCYSGDIIFRAKWCKYRHKQFESYQKVCPYQYGDEIKDLNFSDAIKFLYKDLKNCKAIE